MAVEIKKDSGWNSANKKKSPLVPPLPSGESSHGVTALLNIEPPGRNALPKGERCGKKEPKGDPRGGGGTVEGRGPRVVN